MQHFSPAGRMGTNRALVLTHLTEKRNPQLMCISVLCYGGPAQVNRAQDFVVEFAILIATGSTESTYSRLMEYRLWALRIA